MKHVHGLSRRRKRWALRQRDLAFLVGVTRPIITRYELGKLAPSARRLLALEVIFGRSGRQLFPEAYAEIQDQVMRRAANLDRRLAKKTDAYSVRIRMLLRDMARRVEPQAV